MKKSILLIFRLLSLNAQAINQNNQSNKHINTNKYEVGYSFFKNKNYDVAYEIFNALFKNNLEDKQINFYLGRSAFELKKYDEAYSAYERILIKYPNETRAKLELARIDFIQGRYKNSKKLFLELKQGNLPKKVQKNIDMYLSKIEQKTQKSFINGIYMIGLGYDSNINNRANNDTFYIPSNSLTFTNTTKDESSVNIYGALFLNHKYQYKDNITIKNDFLVYAKAILKDSSKNIGFVSYTPSVVVTYDNTSIQYSVFTDFLRYDNTYYMNSYGMNPKLSYMYSSKTIFEIGFKYQNKNNKIDKNSKRDSIYKSLNFNMKNILNNKYTLITNLNFYNENKKSGILSNIDYDSKSLNLLLKYKYSKMFSINPSILYKDKQFKDINNIYLKKQEDKEYIYNINTLYSFSNSWINKIDISHINVKSNFDSNTYKKNTISISFMKRF